ncbi:MAG TPA: flavodoxin domain-containing protein [Microthrixaceae bacterium]|nr:flavodoxin domain-containing protein [Microthrixaceae bacterium]
MNVLVGYSSAHGSTEGVASAIAVRLRLECQDVSLRSIDEVDSLDGVDAVVLGSAIHNRAWLPPAIAFVEEHTPELSDRPLWLFSVSSVGDTSSVFGPRVARKMLQMRPEPAIVSSWRTRLHVRDHRNFAGVVQRSDWGLVGAIFIRVLGGKYGDHRDWWDIDLWADTIATFLGHATNT